jgi:S-formylglutathione hydrolase FrmB
MVSVVRRASWHAVAAGVALLAVAGAAASLLRSSREVDEGITSIALGGRVHARVILPAGYDDSTRRRYPVVYFLHGLPGSSASYQGNDWLLDAIAAAGPAILVLPQGARDSDTDPEYLDWGRGRNWATYIDTELPRYIDAHFRTIANRRGRAIIGLSAGGYGAAVLGLNHLDRYSVVESWSGYFHPTDPTGTQALDRGPSAVVHTLIPQLRADRHTTFLAFYVGRGDKRFRDENIQLDHELTAAHVPHLFELYQGAHETILWQKHAAGWLALALRHLAPPT